ncbi:1ede1d7d-4623-4826-867a-4e968220c402-CDS [Sclerotinia trifoliorum]|uniref:1ede1d7d-4623-4826-867a-4e968220c402-CDS n=1 Tax=Sclerotinia trifoliorum TaxID=28548 RepID=A0A8H2ZPR8_9HELO|nr:1ede1d7d-4623-4826-867a-4e968220c402-CDS [Sclerotinia trifoliorum]
MGDLNRIERLFGTLERCCNAQRTVKGDDTEQSETNEVSVETFPLNNGGEERKFYWGRAQRFTCRLILFYCFFPQG